MDDVSQDEERGRPKREHQPQVHGDGQARECFFIFFTLRGLVVAAVTIVVVASVVVVTVVIVSVFCFWFAMCLSSAHSKRREISASCQSGKREGWPYVLVNLEGGARLAHIQVSHGSEEVGIYSYNRGRGSD